ILSVCRTVVAECGKSSLVRSVLNWQQFVCSAEWTKIRQELLHNVTSPFLSRHILWQSVSWAGLWPTGKRSPRVAESLKDEGLDSKTRNKAECRQAGSLGEGSCSQLTLRYLKQKSRPQKGRNMFNKSILQQPSPALEVPDEPAAYTPWRSGRLATG